MIPAPQAIKGDVKAVSSAAKEIELRRMMRGLRNVLVAYSGGVDSTYLAFIATQELGANAVCVMGNSPSVSKYQRSEAVAAASSGGFDFTTIETLELQDENYAANPANRCYFCKSELFEKLQEFAAEHGRFVVVDGTNADDLADHRPGRAAAAERNVRSPLAEVGFSKAEIRERSRSHDLRSWDKPASPCLSSRIAHGVPVTIERLSRVELAEQALREEGFREFRVRVHDGLARIEIAADEFARALDITMIARVRAVFKQIGFKYVTLDLEGFRSGSTNGGAQFGAKTAQRKT